jgi:hypothetical protein
MRDFFALLACAAVLSGLIVLWINARKADRDGSWHPHTSSWSGRHYMRRRISAQWEYRLPTDAEIDQHHDSLHP